MSHSSSLWMTPRNGDVNCEACTNRPPCMNHDLTFGANLETYSRAINISQIALTEIILLTTTTSRTTEAPTTPQTTATNNNKTTTKAPLTQTTATETTPPETTATEGPALRVIMEEESRLQKMVRNVILSHVKVMILLFFVYNRAPVVLAIY